MARASPAVVDAFVRALGRPSPAWLDLPASLGEALTRAQRAWPTVELDEPALAAYLAARLPAATDVALAGLHVEDLGLAWACSERREGALERFEADLLPRVDGVVRRYDPRASFAEEVRQALRERLFVRAGAAPARITEYTGRGPLVAWLRASAARTALNLLRPGRRAEVLGEEALELLPHGAPEPDLAILKSRHRDTFRDAFRRALAAVPLRERTALKLNALEGLTLERIGTIYKKDKSTISRWLAHAQQVLLEETRRHLAAALGVALEEVDSLLPAFESQLASVLRQLRD